MVGENKSWTGSDLMPKENPYGVDKADHARFFKSVSTISKNIAQGLARLTGSKGEYDPGWIDVSPENIDLMYDTITGSAGRFVKNMIVAPFDLATKEEGKKVAIAKIPFANKVMGSWSERSISNRYYEKSDEIERFKKTYKLADQEERSELSTDPRLKMVKDSDATDKIIKKMRETREKIEKSGKSTELVDQKIIAAQAAFLKRSEQWAR
jgi:hypothetical protein